MKEEEIIEEYLLIVGEVVNVIRGLWRKIKRKRSGEKGTKNIANEV